jgi:hypothetical protein
MMAANARPDRGNLLITFRRVGEENEQRTADDGVKAVTVAMRMLALRDELQPGDTLTVHENRPRLVAR